jgi:DNA repair protein SbcC/Rad50
MKILHTSDWHLGRSLYTKTRYAEHEAFLDWLAQCIEQEHIDALLVAGDIFDSSTPSTKAQELYFSFLARVAKLPCCRDIIITGGNHDSPALLQAARAPLQALRIHVVASAPADPKHCVLPLSDAQGCPALLLCPVPFLRDKDVRQVSAGESLEEKSAKLVQGVAAYYQAVCEHAESIRGTQDIPLVVMGHCFTAGGRISEGDGVRELYVGSLAHIPAEAFSPAIDYLALGHLHAPQLVANKEHWHYSGAPLPMSFSEAEQEKSLCIVEFSGRHAHVQPVSIPCWQALRRLKGDKESLCHALQALRMQGQPCWLEIEHTGNLTPNLHEELEDLVHGSPLEIVRIKERSLSARTMALNTAESLEDLSVQEVFTRCLDSEQVPDAERPALMHSFAEIAHTVGTEPSPATGAGCLAALHSVRFANLNSLMGEWNIDFCHEAYRTDGIFAITGATGAGKSTLLDAICLALYGMTPRLGKITASANAIMSRQASFCFAEVTFATTTGLYRAHFSQKRKTRGKNKEGLQEPKYEISQLPEGTVLASKAREAATLIENITGMNFDRFSRAILLAQGDFAAFLRANADTRAPLLEQITQTEIYSQLSKVVHERFSKEKEALIPLEAEKKALQLATEAEQREQQQALQRHRAALTALQHCTQQVEAALGWQRSLCSLQEQQSLLNSASAKNHAALLDFQPEQARLDAAQRAESIAPIYSEAVRLRQQCQQLEEEKIRLTAALCSKAAQKEEQERLAAQALTQQEQAEAQWQAQAPLFLQVRTLDARLHDKTQALLTSQQRMQECAALLAERQQALLHNQSLLHEAGKAQHAASIALHAHHADASLVEEYSGLAAQLSALADAFLQEKTGRQEQAAAQAAVQQAQEALAQFQESLAQQKQNCAAQEQQSSTVERRYSELLAGKSPTQWREALLALSQQRTQLATAAQHLQALHALQQEQQNLKAAHEKTLAALQLHEHSTASARSEHTRCTAAFDHAVQLLHLVKKIQSLEEERAALQHGQPCPLCGARQHPYCEQAALPPVSENEVERCRALMDAAAQTLLEQEQSLHSLRTQLSNIHNEQEKLAKEEALHTQALAELVPSAAKDAKHSVAEHLTHCQQATELEYQHCLHTMTAIDTQGQALEEHKQRYQQAHTALLHVQAAEERTANALQQAQQQEQEKSTALHSIQANYTEKSAALLLSLRPYGISALAAEAIPELQENLRQRKEQYSLLQQAVQQATQEHEECNNARLVVQQSLQQAEKEAKAAQEHCAAVLHENTALHTERQNLFGEKNVDAAERSLRQHIEQAKASYAAALQAASMAAQAWSSTSALLEQAERTSTQARKTCRKAEEALMLALAQASFADEAAYCAACLSPQEKQALCARRDALHAEKQSLHLQLHEVEHKLSSHKAQEHSMAQPEELQALLEELQALIPYNHERVGALQHSLAQQEKQQQTSKDLAAAIAAQQRELALWAYMHKLIGSADGKKFRNFAQELTFEHVVALANGQLQAMTDRYILLRDPALPLELQVLDTWQGGLSRTTKNLSGGESFLVSLALALALSRMVSKHARVESLFLDEGFGTLDEETLNTALEALANLQKTGRLIGIISHISSLRERIATQIWVKKESGGKSSLHGAGCSSGG